MRKGSFLTHFYKRFQPHRLSKKHFYPRDMIAVDFLMFDIKCTLDYETAVSFPRMFVSLGYVFLTSLHYMWTAGGSVVFSAFVRS